MSTLRIHTTPYSVSYKLESSGPVKYDHKATQVWLNNIAAISAASTFFSAGLAFSNRFYALAVLPLLITSKVCQELANALNFDDPKTLAQIRDNVQNQSLAQILLNYDWETIFHYELVSPEKFSALYRTHVESLPFRALLQCFHLASRGLALAKTPFVIPSPSEWRGKFEEEVKNLSCYEIAEKYPIEDLKTFQLVPSAQIEVLENVRKATDEFLYEKSELKRELREKTLPFHAAFAKAEETANERYAQVALEQNGSFDDLFDILRPRGMRERNLETLENLKNARRVRKFAIAKAEAEFHKKTAPIHKEIDARLEKNQREYDAKIQSYEKNFANARQPLSPAEGVKEVSKQGQ